MIELSKIIQSENCRVYRSVERVNGRMVVTEKRGGELFLLGYVVEVGGDLMNGWSTKLGENNIGEEVYYKLASEEDKRTFQKDIIF